MGRFTAFLSPHTSSLTSPTRLPSRFAPLALPRSLSLSTFSSSILDASVRSDQADNVRHEREIGRTSGSSSTDSPNRSGANDSSNGPIDVSGATAESASRLSKNNTTLDSSGDAGQSSQTTHTNTGQVGGLGHNKSHAGGSNSRDTSNVGTHSDSHRHRATKLVRDCAIEKTWHHIASVEHYSKTPLRPMTMKSLLKVSSNSQSAICKSAEWVRQELSVRLAHRLYDFHRLPYYVLGNPYIKETYQVYIQTFQKMIKISPITESDQAQDFVKLIEKERRCHDLTVDYMGSGLKQIRMVCSDVNLDSFLERFFFFRIGRRIMIDHLLGLHNPRPNYIGHIQLNCRPCDIITARAEEVRNSCRATYGIAPRYSISGNKNTEFAFIPEHLSLILTEVLKNAMRATVEFCTLGNSILDNNGLIIDDNDLPEVQIELYKGKSDVVIKVSDKGGGIPPQKMNSIWEFGYSTANDLNRPSTNIDISGGFIRPEMAGYGEQKKCKIRAGVLSRSQSIDKWTMRSIATCVDRARSESRHIFHFFLPDGDPGFGLPLSRAFARYFGGDIHVQSCFGIGSDVYISLNHIGDQQEALYYEERRDLLVQNQQSQPQSRPHSLPSSCSSSSSLTMTGPLSRQITVTSAPVNNKLLKSPSPSSSSLYLQDDASRHPPPSFPGPSIPPTYPPRSFLSRPSNTPGGSAGATSSGRWVPLNPASSIPSAKPHSTLSDT